MRHNLILDFLHYEEETRPLEFDFGKNKYLRLFVSSQQSFLGGIHLQFPPLPLQQRIPNASHVLIQD